MTINHKGASIFYTDQGTGAPVILLHGFLENHHMWDSLITPLSTKSRIICIDLLGHGLSESIGYVHSMEDMATAVKAVVDHLNLEKITLIGHSMGGYVALAFSKIYSAKTKGLCLLNSTPETDTEERKELRSRANLMAKKHYDQLIRMSFINLFDPKARAQHEIEITKALNQALTTPVRGYIAANSGMKIRLNSTYFWRTTQIKKGMILGSADLLINAQKHEKHYKDDTGFFKIIESGHMSHISNLKETLHNLKSFITMVNA